MNILEQDRNQNNMNPRYDFIDSLRGITLISMILYHFTWDLAYLFGFSMPWIHSTPVYFWQQSICWSFIFLSGFCWSFGHHPIRRGLQIFFFGAVITLITTTFLPEDQIIFGVLTFLGSAMLLLFVLNPLLKKIPSGVGMVLSFLFFFFLKNINWRTIGYAGFSMTMPDSLYRNLFTTYLGFPMRGFYSTDYFAIIPWIFLYICGYYAQKLFLLAYPDIKDFAIIRWKEPVFSYLGRKSIWIYLIHQPLLYLIYLIWSFIK